MQSRRLAFIGDVHGRHEKLNRLLTVLDAREPGIFYVFMGDLIDNKPDPALNQLKVLTRVKALVDAGRALCLMGNHELNAVGWALGHPRSGEPLRAHSSNNRKQHGAFLAEVGEGSAAHQQWLAWFRQRPLYADFGDIRAVHACWDPQALEILAPALNPDRSLLENRWQDAFNPHHPLNHAVDTLLKGPELPLPDGYTFTDKAGHLRRNIRVRWWLQQAYSYRQLAQVPPAAEEAIPDLPLPERVMFTPPPVTVVIGHYTLSGAPRALSEKVICVDYNAAKGDFPLVAWCRDAAGRGYFIDSNA